jgi:formylglycine-generating enzyme required for sulfatase activity
MVVVPAGRFQMGAEPAEHDRYAVPPERASRELPRHTVTISRAFALGKYEVTRQEFAAFVQDAGYEVPPGCDEWSGSRWVMQPGKNWRQPGFPQTDRDPVVCVNGDDAAAYLRWLTQKTGRPYRLPSEAEWEYAARGGTTTPFYWGGEWTEACRFENIADQSTEARGWKNINPCRDGYIYTAPVGSFQANPFGLFDMLGNAVELTADCRNDSYAGAPADGSPWTSGNCTDRIARGGARTHGEAYWVRAANRLFERYRGRLDQMGFRVALSPP